MAEKLLLSFQNLYQSRKSQWWLFLRAAIFGFLLLAAAAGDFRLTPVLFFLAGSVLIYSRPFFRRYENASAFLVFLAASVLGMRVVEDSLLFFPTLIIFSGIFYLLLGVKDYLFIKRSRIYFLSSLLIFYVMFIVFFLADKSDLFFWKYGAVIIASWLLFREWLRIIPSFHFPKREFLASLVSALLVAQVLWVVALLPIGFISAANFMLLFVFILSDFLFKHFMGEISRQFVIQRLALFLILTALIFSTSQWTIVN
jgi:hypothetical protein